MGDSGRKGVDTTTSERLGSFLDRALVYAQNARAASTRRAYDGDWNAFTTWCANVGVRPLPADPAVIAAYIADVAEHGRKVSTITRALAAVADRHRLAGEVSPRGAALVRDTLRGIKRHAAASLGQKTPVLIEELPVLIAAIPDTPAGMRDRALLLLGFHGALRRSEVVGLDVEDVELEADVLRVRIRRSKTDQTAQGRTIAVLPASTPSLCPLTATRAWLVQMGRAEGPLFVRVLKGGRMTGDRLRAGSVATIVKTYIKAAGRNPSGYAGHSLRRGFATSAARAGATEREIARQTGHKDLDQVRVYVEDAGSDAARRYFAF